MIQFHTGSTKLPGALRFNPGRSSSTINGKRRTTTHFVINPLRRVFGVSWKAKWFIGLMAFDAQTYDRPVEVEDVRAKPATDAAPTPEEN